VIDTSNSDYILFMIPSRHFPDQSEFFLLALFIRKNVVKERFYDEILPQFYADGLKYWTDK